MEKILYDYTICQEYTPFHGGSEYADTVLTALLAETAGEGLGVFFWRNRHINEGMFEQLRARKVAFHPLVDIRNIPAIVRSYGYTTIYSALAHMIDWRVLPLPADIRCLFTIHGLRAIELAADGYTKGVDVAEAIAREKANIYDRVFRPALRKTIVTVSDHSKGSILKYYPETAPSDVVVLYSPPKTVKATDNKPAGRDVCAKYSVAENRYGLLVSAGIWYKNALRGIQAYDRLFSENHRQIPADYRVLVLGVREADALKAEIANRARFIFSGYVAPDELESLYACAHTFLYPSLNEGFGYPPLEAMKYNTVCLCSNSTAIPEVCRDMVLYFDPTSVAEIGERILQSFDPTVREGLTVRMQETLPLLTARQERDLQKLVGLITGKEGYSAK
ncbi:MAG: glycosyltransferase [Lachnospiraceae bacterium]|nr:glycosyltransferase [Lachnospiraceae bacterium]